MHNLAGRGGGERHWCIVMLETPVASVLASNVLREMPENVTVALRVNSQTLEDEIIEHNRANFKENHQHALCCSPDLTRLVRSWRLPALWSLGRSC